MGSKECKTCQYWTKLSEQMNPMNGIICAFGACVCPKRLQPRIAARRQWASDIRKHWTIRKATLEEVIK